MYKISNQYTNPFKRYRTETICVKYGTEGRMDIRTAVILYAPPPPPPPPPPYTHWKWRGHKNWLFSKKIKVNSRLSFFQTLLGPCPQYCIPSTRPIGPLVPKKKAFKGFLPQFGMVAILVMWPRWGKQTLVPPTMRLHSMWNLALIGQVVSKEKTSEAFSHTSLRKTSDPWGRANYDPGAGPFLTPGL